MLIIVYISTLQGNWKGESSSKRKPYGLVEIKYPTYTEKIILWDLYTEKVQVKFLNKMYQPQHATGFLKFAFVHESV